MMSEIKKNRHYVVVFDIDSTLCKNGQDMSILPKTRQLHPECPIIVYHHETYGSYYHIFIPYLEILFDYLIQQGARIVIFSSGMAIRNCFLIPELIRTLWGEERYQSLQAAGQFAILSRDDLRYSKGRLGREGNQIKDLQKVIQGEETLLDAVLIEDQASYTAYDQEPCIEILDLMHWDPEVGNEEPVTSSYRSPFAKNNTYYLLGLFKTYFENKAYNQLPLREGIDKILPADRDPRSDSLRKSPFVVDMVDIGLLEVQRQVPQAVFYGSRAT